MSREDIIFAARYESALPASANLEDDYHCAQCQVSWQVWEKWCDEDWLGCDVCEAVWCCSACDIHSHEQDCIPDDDEEDDEDMDEDSDS